jgi:putative ABC transport system ATP-binding protein
MGPRYSPIVALRDPSPAPDGAPAVLCRAVRKIYEGAEPVVALEGVELSVSGAEFVAIEGPSGCGKSTLLHLLAGIDRPTSGDVLVRGRDIGRLPENERTIYRRRDVGLVFQFFNLLPHLDVAENVELPARLDGRSDAAERARALLERVGLTRRARAHPYELSGGEMQRVAIARALVTGSALLLADEPTGNLDSRNGREVLDLLESVRRERGVTLLLATHSPDAARRADRVVEIRDGEIRGAGVRG